jgi:hypothetical protein
MSGKSSKPEPEYELEDIYWLGSHLQYIRVSKWDESKMIYHSNPGHGGGGILNSFENIIEILGKLELSPAVRSEIKATKNSVKEVAFDEYDEENDVGYREDEVVDTLYMSDLREEEKLRISMAIGDLDSWLRIISEDISNKGTLSVHSPTFLNINELIREPSNLFDEETWESLSEQSKQDVIESVRSLAAGCATASTVLSLRVVERLLRDWYKEVLEKEEVSEPWGRVLDNLEDHVGIEGNEPPVVSNLKYLKQKRNEVNHPEKTPSLREAGTTITMIPETIHDINKQIINA